MARRLRGQAVKRNYGNSVLTGIDGNFGIVGNGTNYPPDMSPMIDPTLPYGDFLSIDIYFENGGNPSYTSAQNWTDQIQWGQHVADHAKLHNKPVVIGEFCDEWNDGYVSSRFWNWAVANNVVAIGLWVDDTGVTINHPASCDLSLPANSVTLSTLNGAIGNTPYNGRFWKPHKAIPPAIPNNIGY
jgi:hypothetical protein